MTVDPALRAITLTSLSDAYLQVSVFVAATLALFYGLERALGLDTERLLERVGAWQVPAAALMGALPGCGGAVMVVTQYASGRLGFGAVVAVLTATMGDAAFLLLAREPLTGLAVFALGMVVGTVSGLVVDALHGPNFLRLPRRAPAAVSTRPGWGKGVVQGFWLALMAPGLILGIALAFQIDVGPWGEALGVAGALLCLGMWILRRHGSASGSTVARVVTDTNFVTLWVVVAYLTYELGVHLTGLDLKTWFAVYGPVIPLVGVLVGFLPGCGPQVVVTTLYLNGVVPLSAQLGNAISNDGDALFPALAVAPKASIVATLYSALPALLVAYGYFWLAE
ncbi:MAG: putative manganese transporter [Pseudomonadota bacterium]